jgi:hypothetical protein
MAPYLKGEARIGRGIGARFGSTAREIVMVSASAGTRVPFSAGRAAPLAKAGLLAGLGKAFVIGVPAVVIGVGLGYGLVRAFDVRWDEFSQRAADGEPTRTHGPARSS